MDFCRLCLTMTETNEVLSNHELIIKIKDCVSIQIKPSENYSRQVCDLCLEKINNWYEFKIMCLRSKTILENRETESFVGPETPNDGFNTVAQNYGTRRHLVTMNRKDTAITLINTNLNSDWEEEDSANQQEDFSIAFKQLDDHMEEDEIDIKHEYLATHCDVDHSTIYIDRDMESKIYSCELCTRSFEYYIDYLDHQNDHNGEAVFHCAKCKMTFSSKQDIVKHEKTHKIACKICGVLVQRQSIRLHLIKHTDKFRCTHCSLRFTCAPLLRDHITARHMKLKLQFCDVCGKDFATKSSLVLHLKTHSDERQYKCQKCDYAGRTSISLNIHMSKHENNTCICEYCSKIFKSNRNLYDHLKRVHHSEKKHSCDICGKKFALRYLVEQHKRTHTGIHPYKCMKCSKTFARSDGLSEHMKTHNRTETFTCLLCSKNFLTPRGIKRHNCVMQPKTK